MQRHSWQLNAPTKQHATELEKLMFADVCDIHDSLALVLQCTRLPRRVIKRRRMSKAVLCKGWPTAA
jgi:hypothetical protein